MERFGHLIFFIRRGDDSIGTGNSLLAEHRIEEQLRDSRTMVTLT
jgi:hypothetical protein